MAHGITNTDQMFSVKETPWHGKGVILPDLATAKEAIEAANLNWKVSKVPVTAKFNGQEITTREHYSIVREDTNTILGVVGNRYEPLQNTSAFSMMDSITQDPGGPKYVTAGSLHGGKKVWMLAKLPSFIEVTSEDLIEEYLLMSNTHDYSRKVEILWTPIRVVCQNTLSCALSKMNPGVAAGQIRFKHFETSYTNQAIENAQDALGIVRQCHDEFLACIDQMKSSEPTEAECDEVLKKLFMAKGSDKLSKRAEDTISTVKHLFREDPTVSMPGVRNTWYGLYNSLTYYHDHVAPIQPAKRSLDDCELEKKFFETGRKVNAFDLIMTASR
jgi:phage/plasmid-like protein (TIGR03299 family)